MIRIYYDHAEWHPFMQKIVVIATCYELNTTQTVDQVVKAAIKAGGIALGVEFIPWHRVYRICET